MITSAEIKRLAARWQVDPMVVDLDYSLGWFLRGLQQVIPDEMQMIFKGGTCLRKCYFEGYRFSEDLDFTCLSFLDMTSLKNLVRQITDWSLENEGPDFNPEPPRFEIIDDEYSMETFQVRVYYRGPLDWGGSPRAVRMDITRNETIMDHPVKQRIFHPFSDIFDDSVRILCYSLLEIFVEKIRAFCGQRKYTISRDLFDLYHLIKADVVLTEAAEILPKKYSARGLEISTFKIPSTLDHKKEFQDDWNRNLAYLIPRHDQVQFEEAWDLVIETLKQIEAALGKM